MGTITSHIDDISVSGEPDLSSVVRRFVVKRPGNLKVQELAPEDDFSATLPRGGLTRHLEFPPAPPKSRAGRKEPLSMDEVTM